MKNKSYLNVFFFVLIAGTLSFSAQNKTNESKQIKNLIAKKRAFNNTYGYGFRIQIYYGNETTARSLQGKFRVNFPDVFTKPFESLNFTLNKAFGEKKNSSIDIKVSNILGAERESVYQSFRAEDKIFSLRKPGTEFSIGYSYKF